MRSLAAVAGLLAAALALVTCGIYGFGDEALLVPPPDSVSEGFVRHLAAGRHANARALMFARLAEVTDAGAVREAARTLHARVGRVIQVEGEPGWSDGRRAQATVVVRTPQRAVPIAIGLRREAGLWKVNEVEALGLRSPEP